MKATFRYLALAALLFAPSIASAQTTHTVCAGGGCSFTSLQSAINAAGCGDTISLAATETFTGNFQLTNTTVCGTPITIRSNTADGSLPADGYRITTGEGVSPVDGRWGPNGTVDYRPVLANIKASAGGAPAIKANPGARDYVLKFLEILPNPQGYGVLIELGVNTFAQRLASQQPRNITVDRVVAYGDPIYGQKVGIDMNGANITVQNSMVYHITGVLQDTIGVRAINSSGPLFVLNNFIEGSTYSMIIGGDDPHMTTQALVNVGATTTTATLSSFVTRTDGPPDPPTLAAAGNDITTLHVGQRIAFLAGVGTKRYHPYITACGTTVQGAACTSANLTFTAIAEVPDTGALSDARWGELPNGITIRRNHLVKRTNWMDPSPIIPANGPITLHTAQIATGTLAANTYYHRVVPYTNASYNGNNAYGLASPEVSTQLTGTGQISLGWAAVPNATNYRVYRGTAAGTTTGYFVVTTNSATDTGQALTATTSFQGASRWVVKNVLEMKFGLNWQVDSNIWEWDWKGSDIGYMSWLKSNNQGATCEFCESRNMVIERNIMRHVAGGFNILGTSRSGADAPPNLNNATIRHNLIYDSTDYWMEGSTVYAIKLEGGVHNLTVDHNTWIHSARGWLYLPNSQNPGLVVTNNIMRRETYGLFGSGCTAGTDCMNDWASGPPMWQFAYNVMCGVTGTAYPQGANNLYPSCTEFDNNTQFISYSPTGGNYALQDTSTWKGNASDGTDRGANISAVLTSTTGVMEGLPEGAVSYPSITTIGVPNATQSVAYSTSVTATGGTAPYTWSLATGALPTGVTLSAAGLLSGTPTATGTFNFTVRATDGAALQDTQALILIVQVPVAALNITTPPLSRLPAAIVPVAYSATVVATGGTPPYTFDLSAGTMPDGLTLSSTGVVTGIPTVAGSYNFTARVTDDGGGTDTQALGMTVSAESACPNRLVRVNFIEAVIYRRPTPPGALQCPLIGDLWLNTSTNPPQANIITRVTPSVLTQPLSQGNHNLLSPNHTDTNPEAAVGGALITGLDNGTWGVLPPGNGFLRQTAGTLSYNFDGSQLTNIPETALPPTITRTRFNADIFGAANYLAFTNSTDPGAPSDTTFARIYYDITTKKFRAWENGTVKDLIAVSTGMSKEVSVNLGASLTFSNVPIGGGELNNNSRHRFMTDTTQYTTVSMFGYLVAGCASGAALRLQYWDGSVWQSAGTEVACAGGGLKDTIGWTTLVVGARGVDKMFRLFWTDGDGAADPSVANWYVRFR